MAELADKLFATLELIDPFEVGDNEYTIEDAKMDLEQRPQDVINYLLDMIEAMI